MGATAPLPFISGKAGSPCVLLEVDGFRVEEPLPLPLSEEESSETRGLGVSGFNLRPDRPVACQRSLRHPKGCLGSGQCPPLPPTHHYLASLHPCPTGPPPHSRPLNFSFLCLRREEWIHCNTQLPTSSCKQARPKLGSLDTQTQPPRSALRAWPSNLGH